MKNVLMILVGLICISAVVSAQQMGTVSGIVYDDSENPVANAVVHLTAEGWHGGHGHGGHGQHEDNYFDETEDDGSFFIDEVVPGNFYAMASLMGYGHDLEEIVVVAGQNTEVIFTLEMGGHGGDHHDSLLIVELAGFAIVEEDSFYTHYYLDIEGDETADYRLSFGPEWYDPDNGAARPADGDSIWIVGGLMGYSEPQMVVVYEINGLFWREPGEGHGGHGGNGGDCPGDADSLTLIEVDGTAIVEDMPHMDMYFIDIDDDQVEDYHLNFGAPWYDPGNGATRPNDGDQINIVGGLMDNCDGFPVIIVYEINGQFWREPGDTSGLWLSPTSAEEFNDLTTPRDFIIAKNYPNPFNPSTVLSFELKEASPVKISVYDVLGRAVAVLAEKSYPAGKNEVNLDPADFNSASSAVYFYKIETPSQQVHGKMMLLK